MHTIIDYLSKAYKYKKWIKGWHLSWMAGVLRYIYYLFKYNFLKVPMYRPKISISKYLFYKHSFAMVHMYKIFP